jgi:Na+-transporting methylmalonyl-CoA/oxaloacetate decarboxylase gamma subunit
MAMENLSAALRLAVLGLATTFAALLALRLIIGMLTRISVRQVQQDNAPNTHIRRDLEPDNIDEDIAAISAVLCAIGATPNTGGRIHIEKIRG